MSGQILIMGAGIAGLSAALALGGKGRELVVIDRDPPPPETSADEAFASWERRGVGHLRHSHAFLARLHILIRDNYPELMRDLLAAGCREIAFADHLPPSLQKKYKPAPGDDDLVVLTSRRTTLELVMRRHVARREGVRFLNNTKMRGLLTERTGGALRVRGVRIEDEAGLRDLHADIVIDAAGKNSQALGWLRAEGLRIAEENAPAGIVYFTRHYRLRDGADEPARGAVPSAGDLGFIKYGVFPADNRCFSITIAVPEIEMELRKAIVKPEIFDRVCAALPGVARWTSPGVSLAVSRVLGMGELVSRWHHMLADGAPLALDFFPLGDSLIRTNPLYGRGCSFAAIEAHILRDVLDRSDDPVVRARLYHRKVWSELRPFYDVMVRQDAAAIRRARHALDPAYAPRLKARLLRGFAEDAVMPAVRDDPDLMRAAMRAFHMLEPPSLWLKDAGNITKIMRYWLRGRKRNAALYPPKLGPDRSELLVSLGLSPLADRPA